MAPGESPLSSGEFTLSVVICTLDGATRLPTVLAALGTQTAANGLEVIVVDDGSRDGSSQVAASYGRVQVVRHDRNRGLAAARNTGLNASSAPWVAFLDDDCEPEPRWAEQILEATHRDVVGVGGAVTVAGLGGFVHGYLERNNPLAPLEAELAASKALAYRCWRYVLRNVRPAPTQGRTIYSVVGANMAFDRAAVGAVGGFDERFTFGAEELDLCLRLQERFGSSALWFEPAAVVRHHFDTRARALLHRHRAYGFGVARLYRKRSDFPPTVYPFPAIVIVLLLAGVLKRRTLVVAALFPQIAFGRGVVEAVRRRSLSPLGDCYVRLLEEASSNLGWVIGAWHYRNWPETPG